MNLVPNSEVKGQIARTLGGNCLFLHVAIKAPNVEPYVLPHLQKK